MSVSTALKPLVHQLKSYDLSARLFLLATLIDGVIFSAWMLFFNFYILERGYDRGYLGLVNAMPSLCALIFGIPLGMLSDKIGRKPAMLVGVAISLLCMGLEVTVLNPNLILGFAFLGGIGNMLYWLSQAPFIMQVSNSENRNLLFSLNFGLVTLSGAVGSLFAGQLPSLFGRWLHVAARSATAYQAVLLTSVFLGCFALLPLALIRENKPTPLVERPVEQQPLRKVILQPFTLKLALPNVLIGFGAAILLPYMNVFFLDRFSLPDKRLGVLFSLLALFTGIGSIFAPRLVDIFGGKIRAIVITQSASLVFLILNGFAPWFGLVSLSFLMRGTLMNMAVPLYYAFAMEQVDQNVQGTVNSVMELAWQAGWTVGPYISGLVQESYGFNPLFISTGIFYALANVFTWMFFRKTE